MTKINARCFNPNAVPRKIISAKYPPTETMYRETHLRHRDGSEIIFVSEYYGGHGEQTGWCMFCSFESSRYENGNCKYMTTGQFYSYRNHVYQAYVCPDCKKKNEAALKIEEQIRLLKKQLDEIDGI